MTVAYLWGVKEHIEWHRIRDITKYGSWLDRYSGLPEYHIEYFKKEKHPFFVDGNIPKTVKTKNSLNSFIT